MIEQLAKILSDFSEVNRTRCFLHIVNLCAKSIIRQFDVQKQDTNEPMDDTEHELQVLAEEIDLEEQQAAELLQQHAIDGEANGSSENDDDTDGWVDEMAVLSLAERTELHEEIRPVKLVLVKVCATSRLITIGLQCWVASKGGIQGYQLVNETPSSMATAAEGTQEVRPNHAQRCDDTLEFDL
jgi:hypothetical protein